MASSNERTLTLLLALSGALASSGCVVTVNGGDDETGGDGDSASETASESGTESSGSGDGDAGDGDSTSGDGDSGDGDGDSGDGDGGTTAGDGDGDSPCQAWAEAYVPCLDQGPTVEEAAQECEDYLDYGYLYGEACGAALADFYACLSTLDCAAMESITGCETELADYELACGEAGDGDGDGDSMPNPTGG